MEYNVQIRVLGRGLPTQVLTPVSVTLRIDDGKLTLSRVPRNLLNYLPPLSVQNIVPPNKSSKPRGKNYVIKYRMLYNQQPELYELCLVHLKEEQLSKIHDFVVNTVGVKPSGKSIKLDLKRKLPFSNRSIFEENDAKRSQIDQHDVCKSSTVFDALPNYISMGNTKVSSAKTLDKTTVATAMSPVARTPSTATNKQTAISPVVRTPSTATNKQTAMSPVARTPSTATNKQTAISPVVRTPSTATNKQTAISSVVRTPLTLLNSNVTLRRKTQIASNSRFSPPFTSQHVDDHVYGMPNIGNSCYINATLQVVFNTEFFDRLYTLMKKLFDGDFATRCFDYRTEAPLCTLLVKIFTTDVENRRHNLEKFREYVNEKSQLTRSGQEDAHEFLMFLFQHFDAEMKAMGKAVPELFQRVSMTSVLPPRLSGDARSGTLAYHAFTYRRRVIYRCESCRGAPETSKTDESNHFILQVVDAPQDRNVSINDMLLNSLSSDAESHWKCVVCGQPLKQTHLYFDHFPRYIVLLLSRYKFSNTLIEMQKDSTCVIVNQRINFVLPSSRASASQRISSSPPRWLAVVDGEHTTPKTSKRSAAANNRRLNINSFITSTVDERDFLSDDEESSSTSNRHTFSIKNNFSSSSSPGAGDNRLCDDNNSEEELSILKENIQSPKLKARFTPVDFGWRKNVCDMFKIRALLVDQQKSVYESHRICNQRDVYFERTERPAHTADVPGDGNCLFHALSHIITGGNMSAHEKIREMICDFLQFHQEKFRGFVRSDNPVGYLRDMRKSGEWGGSAELIAFATMTQTPVHTFVDDKWAIYNPRFPLVKLDDKYEWEMNADDYDGLRDEMPSSWSNEVVYLCNVMQHFEPVLSMKKTLTYKIRGVVNHLGEKTEYGHYLSILRRRSPPLRFSSLIGASDSDTGRGEVWLKCDDSIIMPVEEEQALLSCSMHGYLFFYESDHVEL